MGEKADIQNPPHLPISESESVTTFLFLGPLLATGLAVADFLGTTFEVGAGAVCFLAPAMAIERTLDNKRNRTVAVPPQKGFFQSYYDIHK
jgi:hypothetical protein